MHTFALDRGHLREKSMIGGAPATGISSWTMLNRAFLQGTLVAVVEDVGLNILWGTWETWAFGS